MDPNEQLVLTNLRKGVLEFCVLAALGGSRQYGRELAQSLQASQLLASEGTLYPLLSRLRASGLVDTEWEESEIGRQRRYYTLTDAGRGRLSAFRLVWAPLRDTVDDFLENEQ